MEFIKKIENKLVGINATLPVLPKEAKEWLAKVWPWFALIGGAVQVVAAWFLWDVVRVANNRLDDVNNVYKDLTGHSLHYGYSATDKTIIYGGIIMLLISGVIALMAWPKLKARDSKGWDLLFLALLIEIVYTVYSLIVPERGFGGFISSLIGVAISAYLLFQMRDVYKHNKAVGVKPSESKTEKKSADN
jgi:hypothetical protein